MFLTEEWNNSVGVGDNVDLIVNPNDKPGHEEGDIVKDKPSDDNNWSDLIESIEEFLKDLDDWDETKNDLPVNLGSLDTLLMSNDNMLLKLAPREGRTPLNIIHRGVGTGRVGRAMALPIICLKLVFPIDNNTNDSQWPYQ